MKRLVRSLETVSGSGDSPTSRQGDTELLHRQFQRQSALADMELVLSTETELQNALENIVQVATDLLPATGGASVILWDERQQAFVQSAATVPGQAPQMTRQRVRQQGGATRWIIDHREPLVVSDIQADPFGANPVLAEYGLKAYAGMPLVAEDKSIGVLYALEQHERSYSPSDLDFLRALANRAAAAITRFGLCESLREARSAASAATLSRNEILTCLRDEISPPISGILGMADRALHTDLTPQQRDYIKAIKDSGGALCKILDRDLAPATSKSGSEKSPGTHPPRAAEAGKPPPAPPAVLDSEKLLFEVEGDIGLLRQMIALFVETTPALLEQLRAAVAAHAARTARAAAHTLKGTASQLCAPAAYSAALQLELAFAMEDFSGAAERLLELEFAFQRLDAALSVLAKTL